MKKLAYLIAVLLAGLPACGVMPRASIGTTVDVSQVSGNWDQWKWNMVTQNDYEVTLYMTNAGSPFDMTGTYAGFRVSRQNVAYIDKQPSSVTCGPTTVTFLIDRTNIPPNATYDCELWAYENAATNYARTLGQGLMVVTKSLYSDTNLFPFPTPVSNLTDYLTITGAAALYVTKATFLASNSVAQTNWQGRMAAVEGYTNEAHTAYGWGNHATNGYLTSFTESDPLFASWRSTNTIDTRIGYAATNLQAEMYASNAVVATGWVAQVGYASTNFRAELYASNAIAQTSWVAQVGYAATNYKAELYASNAVVATGWVAQVGYASTNYRAELYASNALTLLTNGTRAMGADLNMGSNDMTNVETVTFAAGSILREFADGAEFYSRWRVGTAGPYIDLYDPSGIVNNDGMLFGDADTDWLFLDDSGATLYQRLNMNDAPVTNASGVFVTGSGGFNDNGTNIMSEVSGIKANTNNYQTAYDWGDHATNGYATAGTNPVPTGTAVLGSLNGGTNYLWLSTTNAGMQAAVWGLSTDMGCADNVKTTLVWNSVLDNMGMTNGMNTATGIFTAPSSGRYDMAYSVGWIFTTATSGTIVRGYADITTVSGTTTNIIAVSDGRQYHTAGTIANAKISALLHRSKLLNAGDTVYCGALLDSDSAETVESGNGKTYFEIEYKGAP